MTWNKMKDSRCIKTSWHIKTLSHMNTWWGVASWHTRLYHTWKTHDTPRRHDVLRHDTQDSITHERFTSWHTRLYHTWKTHDRPRRHDVSRHLTLIIHQHVMSHSNPTTHETCHIQTQPHMRLYHTWRGQVIFRTHHPSQILYSATVPIKKSHVTLKTHVPSRTHDTRHTVPCVRAAALRMGVEGQFQVATNYEIFKW